MIVTVTAHKTVEEIAVISAGPELADTMGKFEFARWQQAHKVYWVETKHLETMTRQLDKLGHTVVDQRRANTDVLYTGPLPECASCGAAASRRGDRVLRRCTNCGAPWRSTIYDGPGAAVQPMAACTACAHKQRPGANFCGQCGAQMPEPEGGAPRPAIAHVERPPLQDPLPVAAAIPEHIQAELDARAYRAEPEEEPDREWYP